MPKIEAGSVRSDHGLQPCVATAFRHRDHAAVLATVVITESRRIDGRRSPVVTMIATDDLLFTTMIAIFTVIAADQPNTFTVVRDTFSNQPCGSADCRNALELTTDTTGSFLARIRSSSTVVHVAVIATMIAAASPTDPDIRRPLACLGRRAQLQRTAGPRTGYRANHLDADLAWVIVRTTCPTRGRLTRFI